MTSSRNGARKLLPDQKYAALAAFRFELRRFLHFSEGAARGAGLTPQQHQALLSIRGADGGTQSIGELAERLLVKPHSATGLAGRLVAQGLVERLEDRDDRRVVRLRLTPLAEELLANLARTHQAELKRIKPLLKTLIDKIG